MTKSKTKAKPTEVFVVTVSIYPKYVPKDVAKDVGKDVSEVSITLVFDKHPSANEVYAAYEADSFIQKYPLYKTLIQQLSYCLCTWGMPSMQAKPFGDIEVTSVCLPWIANIHEAKAGVSFNEEFGSIRIVKKSINIVN